MLPVYRISPVLMVPVVLLACSVSLPTGPSAPSGEKESGWEDVLAGDPSYPPNVYLTRFVEWEPGSVGTSRYGTEYTDESGKPLESLTVNALGPPEGGGSFTGGEALTCPVGAGGWAVWAFNDDFVVIDGPGPDFRTFCKTWAWGGAVNGLCSELAHVQVSGDGMTWYGIPFGPGGEEYDINPDPSSNNGNYVYRSVSNLHGNEPTWANFRKDMPAEHIADTGDGIERWVEIEGVTVSRYFLPSDPYLGGSAFDLADFRLVGDAGIPWPEDGEMRYLKIIDDDTILDGQDYAKDWRLGANLSAAMAMNFRSVP